MKAIRLYWLTAAALSLVVVATHVVAALRHPEWWGAHFYRFLDPAVLWIACASLALAGVLAWRWPGWLERAFTMRPLSGAARGRWPWIAVMSAGSLWLFWTFREAHTLLGDGHPLTENLPLGQQFHPDEPLALFLHQQFYRLTRALFAHPGRALADIAHDTVGLSSALAGALFVPIAWRLSRSLATGRATDEAPPRRGGSAPTALVFLALIAQGYLQLFFGYVENYTLSCLVIAAFALCSMLVIEGRAPLILPVALVIFDSALHLAGALLVPALGVLLVQQLLRPAGWRAAARDLAIGLAILAATNAALALLHPHYSWFGMLAHLAGSVTRAGSSYGFKRPGAGDFLNQQMLIGPLGLFLFLPAAAGAALGGVWRSWKGAFFVALGGAFVIASVIAGDSNLGVARNWDLLAPAGFVFTLAALALALAAEWPARDLSRWLFLLGAVSLFHTVPWIANNASFDRAFARFKTLPLGLGRAQAVVGSLYLERGQADSAAVWFRRALDENSANNLAAFELGRIAMSRGNYQFACQAFRSALEARPGTQQYQYLLAGALVRSGRPQYARQEVDALLRENPGEPIYWA
ncbi:MAG: tetratricopeptide repeat protein, partial [Candidatus Eiseniibacteriota bacterium]